MSEIVIERDPSAEEYAKIIIEGCAAAFGENEQFVVIGEAVTKTGRPITHELDIHATVYDIQGRLVGRGSTYLDSFGIRQSFEILIELLGENKVPAKVRVFPTKNE